MKRTNYVVKNFQFTTLMQKQRGSETTTVD